MERGRGQSDACADHGRLLPLPLLLRHLLPLSLQLPFALELLQFLCAESGFLPLLLPFALELLQFLCAESGFLPFLPRLLSVS
ncbi:hypothetical protein [Streptomyces sp. URMC 124]|uniref:hypothetical protein n=1 Tax=Streptomyces sp. URMC 124 TaxID=3423405 RepID=UPI003F1B0023